MTTYRCPPECGNQPYHPDDPIHCPRSQPVEVCFVHLVEHLVDGGCPICRSYITAGL